MTALEGLTIFTVITLVLCLFGVGLLIVPVVAVLWVLYFFSTMTVGGGIATVGIAIMAALIYCVRKNRG